MRARPRRVFVPVAAVAASTVLFACHRGDSILLVEVAGDLRLQPASFQVTVEPAQAGEKVFRIMPQGASSGATVPLPASFSIEMAPNLTGPVTVTVAAFDVRGYSVGYGSATQTDINVGGETIVVVNLTPSTPFPVDAGTDAVFGTGGSGVDASGAGGLAGSGVAGSGGAAGNGPAGSSGAGGVPGSGGVTGSGGAAGSGGKGGISGTGGKAGSGGSTGTGGMAGAGGVAGKGGASGSGGGAAGAGGAAGSSMGGAGSSDAGGGG